MNGEPLVRTFDTPAPVQLYVENGAGRIVVVATDTAITHVRVAGLRADEATVTHDRDRISVIAPKWRGGLFRGDQSLDMEIEVPTGSSFVAKSGSADIDVTGEVAATKVKAGSGQVRLECIGESAVVDTGSGDVAIGAVAGALKVRSGSGDVVLDSAAGTTSISSGSGDIRIGHALSPVVVKTGSGDLEVLRSEDDIASTTGSGRVAIRSARRGRISAKGASGDIVVGVPAGTPVWTDITSISGRISSTLPSTGQPEPGVDHVEIRATTVSGDVALVPA
ncbi:MULTISPECIES: DUF4097 family beta strand repeat-containing protein [unclassified Nocardioides]|uniref:DUF4097 family beta strand repeat-containing protein n=1 Tax=unclassified Nocardioides TaxID=2615069 RepID=UPI000703186B|nr:MULTISPECIES: DUF4097 family beta strand repeat-containing protein [unclassified Nocardioides]KRC52896.1 hypothetical protein ASE19_10840 [Nocardioides sp. Root79]KRC72426.1 hypothetical protein ASE20_07375 [Nocardioides sp. Root240]